MAGSIIPEIRVKRDEHLRLIADAARGASNTAADALTTLAAYLHPQMVRTMQRYGLDGTNRFGFGSDANKAADKVVHNLKRAAECYTDGGRFVGYAYVSFMREVWEPVKMAKEALKKKNADLLDV